MKKLLIVIAIVVALAAILFASPILGREGKHEATFYGSAYAGEGGGGGF
jgi:hypothetical protein